MYSTVLWEVDVQRDFMLSGGALYVPGAERIIPNINRLVDLARRGQALLISSACQHTAEDPEFKDFPPHCVRGTPGAELLPEARADRMLTVPSVAQFTLPADVSAYQQILFEKQNIDVFTNPNVGPVIDRFSVETDFVVFGVVTEYCVKMAAAGLLRRGRRAFIVTDAIETLQEGVGKDTLACLADAGARFVTTGEVCRKLGTS